MIDVAAPWHVQSLLNAAAQILHTAGIDAPRRNAEWMLEDLLGCSRAQLFVRAAQPVSAADVERLNAMLAQRLARVPLQYILGHAEFYGLRLRVTPAVLIPRPETEQVVETALRLLEGTPVPRVLDVGTGSGCIALALKHERPAAEVCACDVSPEALAVARQNGAALALSVTWLQADALAPDFPRQVRGPFDLLISNPPYIERAEAATLEPEVRDHEPHRALFTDGDALRFYRAIGHHAQTLLLPGGWLVFETHADHGAEVADWLRSASFAPVHLQDDFAGLPRIVAARWR